MWDKILSKFEIFCCFLKWLFDDCSNFTNHVFLAIFWILAFQKRFSNRQRGCIDYIICFIYRSGISVMRQGLLFAVRCITDLRTARGRLFSQILSIFQICSFAIVSVAYGAIWIKIKHSLNQLSFNDNRYGNSARVMMIFVAIFILQVCCFSNV